MSIRYLSGFSCAAILAFVAGCLLGARPLFDYDLYWHLANGREMLSTGRVIDYEAFSFTHSGEAFLNRAWLAQIVWIAIWDWVGPAGLMSFKILIAGTVACLVFVSARLLGASLWVACTMGPVAVLVGLYRYIERPELFSLLLTALVAALLLAWRAGKSPRYVLLPIPFIMILWDWLHGGPYGFLYLFLFVGWANAARWFRWEVAPHPDASIRWLNGVLLATILASIANPWGLLTYQDVASLVSTPNRVAIKTIVEFHSSTWANNPGFFVFLALASVAYLASYRRVGLLGPLVTLAFAMGALEYVRATGVFAIVAAPFVALAFSQLLAESSVVKRWIARGLVLGAMSYWSVTAVLQKWPDQTNPHSLGVGVNDQYLPTGAVEFAKHLDLKGNLFNTGHFGGYLAYSIYPERKIFQYNLPSVFGDAYRYLRPGGASELERWNIQYAFLAMPDELRLLFPNQTWARIYRDMAGVLVVRRTAEHQAIIEAFEAKSFNPMFPLPKLFELAGDPSVRPELIRECVVYLAFRRDDRIAGWLSGLAEGGGVVFDPRYDRYLQLAKAKNPAFNFR